MRARLTFDKTVTWNYKTFLAWTANVQGVPARAMWTLVFRPDIALNDLCFEGNVEWLADPKDQGLVSGAKFQYVTPTGEVFARGEVL